MSVDGWIWLAFDVAIVLVLVVRFWTWRNGWSWHWWKPGMRYKEFPGDE